MRLEVRELLAGESGVGDGPGDERLRIVGGVLEKVQCYVYDGCLKE